MSKDTLSKSAVRKPDPHWAGGYPEGVKPEDKELVPAVPAGPEERQALARPEQSPKPAK